MHFHMLGDVLDELADPILVRAVITLQPSACARVFQDFVSFRRRDFERRFPTVIFKWPDIRCDIY